jgi:hypothetical protein
MMKPYMLSTIAIAAVASVASSSGGCDPTIGHDGNRIGPGDRVYNPNDGVRDRSYQQPRAKQKSRSLKRLLRM